MSTIHIATHRRQAGGSHQHLARGGERISRRIPVLAARNHQRLSPRAPVAPPPSNHGDRARRRRGTLAAPSTPRSTCGYVRARSWHRPTFGRVVMALPPAGASVTSLMGDCRLTNNLEGRRCHAHRGAARSSDLSVVTSPLMLTRWHTRSLLGFLNISVTGEENVARRVPSCCSASNRSAAADPRANASSRLSQCHTEQTRYSRSPGRQGTTTGLPTSGTR